MTDVPEGWTEASIGECFLEMRNGTTAKQNKDGKGVPVSRIETIQNSKLDLRRVQHVDDASPKLVKAFRYRPGDIAFSHINSYEHVGKTALYEGTPKIFLHGMNLLRLRLGHRYVDPQFAYLYMQTAFFRDEVRQRVGHAVNQVSINQKNLADVPFLVPPLNEQRRIGAKLKELLAKVEACQKRLATIPVFLKRFRLSVLTAAYSGELSADWRDQNLNVPDASALLQEVKARRLARQEEESKEAKKRGQKAPALERNDELPDFSEYGLFDLPDTWQWSHVSKFGFVKGGKRLPKGKSLVEENTGHPYLRIRDLKNGTVDRSEIRFVPTEVFTSIRNYTIQHGDVYLTIVGSIGEAGTIPIDFDGASLTENAAKIVQPVGLLPTFLVSWFRSSQCQRIIQQNIHSGGQGKLALFRIEQLPVPLAPLAEQEETVSRLEALFRFADQLEDRYRKAQVQVDKLTESILIKAFRGELVATEAELARREGRDYEPASVLLARIHETRRGK